MTAAPTSQLKMGANELSTTAPRLSWFRRTADRFLVFANLTGIQRDGAHKRCSEVG
jgi:hypothetical protein